MNNRIMKLRSMPYDEYLKTPEWIAKRDEVLDRDDHRCRVCNSEENLNVHHRTYVRRGNEDLNDLTTLCQPCHEYFHERMRQDDMMARTYSAPYDPEERKERKQASARKWGDYLIGLLVTNPGLIPHVVVIVNEHDFATVEAQELYRLLVDLYSKTENGNITSVNDHIPPALKQTLNQCITDIEKYVSVPVDALVREAVQSATHIKKQSLLAENTRLKTLFQEAIDSGDKEAVSDIQQRFVVIQRQLRTLLTASRLQG